jgi:diguanylate cyclase (GGDEF)-like protein
MSVALDLPLEKGFADEGRLAAIQRYDVLDTPREPAFDRVASLIRLIFGVETSVVSLIDGHRQWFKAAEGNKVDELPVGDTFCRHALFAPEPLIVPDASVDPRFKDSPLVTGDIGLRFYAGVPITTPDGLPVGTVCAIDSRPRDFSEKETQILKNLADIVTSELELRRLATTDGLTGISTRRAFKDDALKFVALARRHRSQLSAITFDIDHFKSINDTYGHAAGDGVLKSVSTAVGGLLRESDLLGRLGGEEFAIILPDADAASAMAVAEKLRHSLLNLRFPGSKPPMTVSASFGVATLDPGSDDLDSLLVKADEALYEAKRSGRNRSVAWRGVTAATTTQIERRRVLKAGRLIFNNKQSVIDCTVRSLWDTGAEVQVSNSADIPDEVTLEIRSSGFKWDGTIDMRNQQRLEIAFA